VGVARRARSLRRVTLRALTDESLQVKFKAKGTGRWKVEKGEIVTTVKESTNPKETDKVARTKVVPVDGTTLKVPASVTVPAGTPIPKELNELVIVFKKVK
jgi:hypothetical protein